MQPPPRYDWIDTDDLNDGGKPDDLHADAAGYEVIGQRFADKAIDLIHQHQRP